MYKLNLRYFVKNKWIFTRNCKNMTCKKRFRLTFLSLAKHTVFHLNYMICVRDEIYISVRVKDARTFSSEIYIVYIRGQHNYIYVEFSCLFHMFTCFCILNPFIKHLTPPRSYIMILWYKKIIVSIRVI